MKILKTILYYYNMTSRVFDVSFRNEARRVTMNDNTKIGAFVQKSIGIYDLNVDDITGVYFVDVDNQEVFLHDHAYTKFFETIAVLLREYPYVSLFTITTSRHLRTPQSINKFRREYKRFITNNRSNNRVFFDRPYMNVTNNYYGGQSAPDMILNQLNTPITYYRAEMYVTNNYFNERVSDPSPEPQPQPQPNPVQQPEVRIPESDIINRIFNNPTNNANNIEIELNYLYNPERGRFNIIQNPARNNIIDYIYNIITTTTPPGVNQETINQLRRGTYNNLREHIIPECTQCTISLEDFSDTTEVIVLPCRHAFTADGIRTWLQTNTTCPTCRGDIVSPLTLPNRERFDTPPPIG
jgi:hypothetical protein